MLIMTLDASAAAAGFETAKEFVRMGATVVMACRSIEKAKEAKDRICKATKCNQSKVPSPYASFMTLPLVLLPPHLYL